MRKLKLYLQLKKFLVTLFNYLTDLGKEREDRKIWRGSEHSKTSPKPVQKSDD